MSQSTHIIVLGTGLRAAPFGRWQDFRRFSVDFWRGTADTFCIYSPSDTPQGLRRGFVFLALPKYRNQTVPFPGGGSTTLLALDVVAAARDNTKDVALIFSQGQNLSEVADEVRAISVQQNRWIKRASAFPVSPTHTNTRGINKTDWVRVDRALYDQCLDARDYRPKGTP